VVSKGRRLVAAGPSEICVIDVFTIFHLFSL
jgi:hypothetical protein